MSAPHTQSAVTLRRARTEDAAACGTICYQAFHNISSAHNCPPDIPEPDVARGLLAPMTLMSMGVYTEPDGAWLASILF